MNILAIVQQACRELGLIAPASLTATTDLQIIQLLALANRDCNELYRSRDWTDLQFECILNMAAPIDTIGDVALNSDVISNIPSTAGIEANYFAVSGEGMPLSQRVVEVIDATSVRVEMLSTATALSTPLSFVRDTYAIPSDFDHYITSTWWDRTNHWQLIGPISPQEDQWQRSGIVASGPRRRWRQIGVKPTVFRVFPPPSSADTPSALVFEYVSKNWVLKEDGTYADVMTADTDVPILNDQAVILGIKWRMWQIKGFEYGALQKEYIDFVNRQIARDGGMVDLSLSRRRSRFLFTSADVQDGNFPG